MFMSGCAAASRLTRLSSVPIARLEPGSAASMGLDDEPGRAHEAPVQLKSSVVKKV